MAVNALWTIFDYEEYERWYNEIDPSSKIPQNTILKKIDSQNLSDKLFDIAVVEDSKGNRYKIPNGMLQYYNAQINSSRLYRVLGDTIAIKRTKAGMSQQELGMLIGVGRQVILRLESGKAQAKFDIVFAVAKVLDINLMEVI